MNIGDFTGEDVSSSSHHLGMVVLGDIKEVPEAKVEGNLKADLSPLQKAAPSGRTLSFSDGDFLVGEPKEFIPFVISASILGSDVKRVLIDQSSSADLRFQDLLPKLGFSVSDLSPYHGGNLFGLGPEQTRPIGYLEALVTYGQRKLSRTVNTVFLVVPLVTPYHCIIGRPTLTKLGVVASAVSLKMKFHSLTGEVVTVSADVNADERSQYLAQNVIRPHIQKIP